MVNSVISRRFYPCGSFEDFLSIGLLELDALMRVSDARAVEKRLHKYFDLFRVDGRQRELFKSQCISPSILQAAFVEATLEVQKEIPIAKTVRVNNAKKTFYEDD